MALSIGHLASLYNYDMEKYSQAEELYLRSMTIGMLKFTTRNSYFLVWFLMKLYTQPETASFLSICAVFIPSYTY